ERPPSHLAPTRFLLQTSQSSSDCSMMCRNRIMADVARYIFGRRIQVAHLEDRAFFKDVIAEALRSSSMMATKTLIELGHEPFPLSTEKTIKGSLIYFYPNFFSYAKQLAESHPLGWWVLTTGWVAGSIAIFVRRYTIRIGSDYINIYYDPPQHLSADERTLSFRENLKVALFSAMRDTVLCSVGLIAARPFTVVAIRQIAQVVGGEAKYINFIDGLRVIITEEGIRGLFAGFFPQLVAQLGMVWISGTVYFLVEQGLIKIIYWKGDPRVVGFNYAYGHTALYRQAKASIVFFSPDVDTYLSYTLTTVSTIMACVGSGLAASFLPNTPTFGNWWDGYKSVKGLSRGLHISTLFKRVHTGAVFVGMDKQLYASNTH
ncbi:hypothetical protein PMAYCL1PPCAC_05405, partial [Pristionchus mayeri]